MTTLITPSPARIVSDQTLARLTRQTALHCGLAAVILDKGKRTKVVRGEGLALAEVGI